MPDPVIPDDRGVSGTSGVEAPLTPGSDEDAFSAAFDTAQDEGDKADLSAADDPKNLKEGETKEDDTGSSAKTPEGVAADAKAADKSAEGGKTTTPSDSASATADDPDKIEHKYKTLQGIHRHDKESWEKEKKDLLGQLEEAKKSSSKPADKKEETTTLPKLDEDDLTEEQKEELSAYEEQFDVVSKMEGLKRTQELKKLQKAMQIWRDEILAQVAETKTHVEPAMKLVDNVKAQNHFSAIQNGYIAEDGTEVEGHPDYEKYVKDGSLKAWIETKPGYLRTAMEATYDHGTVKDAIDLISDFKRETQSTQASPDNVVDLASKKAAKKVALAAVNTKRAAVQPGTTSKDDFEGAFDEALNR